MQNCKQRCASAHMPHLPGLATAADTVILRERRKAGTSRSSASCRRRPLSGAVLHATLRQCCRAALPIAAAECNTTLLTLCLICRYAESFKDKEKLDHRY